MRYQDILRWGTISAVFLALFVPFFVASGNFSPDFFFPFITGKNFAFRLLVELALIGYVLLALREPKYRPNGSLLMWCAVLFVGWMAVATLASVDPLKSFWSNFERMEGYLGLLHLFAWFIITGAILTTEKLWDKFLNTAVALSAVQGLWALMQVLGVLSISSQSGVRADTTFGNAAYLGVYFLLSFFITLLMLVRRKGQPGMQVYYGVALVLQFAGLYFTETRGALLGLVGGLIVFAVYLALFARERELRPMRTAAISVLGVLVVLGGLFFALKDTSFIRSSNTLERLASISFEDRTTQSRFLIWNMALQGAQEKPLLGWGQENFSYVFNNYYDPRMYNQEAWFDRAHNQFLDWLIAGGFPAFVLYIALYLLAAWAVWRSTLTKPEKAVLLGLIAGYIFNNLFVFDNLVSAMYFFVLLAYIHGLSSRKSPALWFSKPVGDHALAVAAPIVIGVGLLGMWVFNMPGMVRASTLLQALQTQTTNGTKDPNLNLNSFKSALGTTAWPGNPLGYQEVVEQLMQFSGGAATATGVEPALKVDIFLTSKAAIEHMIDVRKGDARLELFAASTFGAYGQFADALAHIQKALEYSPKKQQIYIQLGALQMSAGNTAEALAAFKTAFDEEPAYELARIYYAVALYSNGQNTLADKLLTEGFGSPAADNDQLLSALVSFKQFDRAAAIWKGRVEKKPDDVQLRLGYASMLFGAGRNAETIAELRKIIQIQPASAAQMEALIKQIQDGTLKAQ